MENIIPVQVMVQVLVLVVFLVVILVVVYLLTETKDNHMLVEISWQLSVKVNPIMFLAQLFVQTTICKLNCKINPAVSSKLSSHPS